MKKHQPTNDFLIKLTFNKIMRINRVYKYKACVIRVLIGYMIPTHVPIPIG